jgi:hypothetical protein
MIGAAASDEFVVLAGQEDTNITNDYSYVVDQNANTVNTYLTTQSYVIDGTTSVSSTPEPGTFALIGCGMALFAAVRSRASRSV